MVNPIKLFSWRLFRFDIIQIEFLSEIYENFLEEFNEDEKEEAGQYYTPPSLVELILNEKLKTKNEINFQFKVLDPACGSGIFLVESFKRLVARWKNANPGRQIEFKDLRDILKNNIFGIELDKFAIRVTAFSLYLAIVEQLNPKTLWSDKRYKFPFLINDPKDKTLEIQGNNLMRADTIGEIEVSNIPRIDLLVGNPPFGSKIKLPSITQFLRQYGYGTDMVIPFLRKAVEFTDEGSIALIFNTKILTNTEKPFQKFRAWLFNETYVEKLYNLSIFRKAPKSFGGQLFSSAVGPVSIIFYQKNAPQKFSNSIEYWSPKTYLKNNLVEGVVIDSTDIKFLPRTECQKPDTKIWKIAMWGSFEDFKLIERLDNNFAKLKDQEIKSGVGFQLMTNENETPLIDDEIANMKYLDADNIDQYYTITDNLLKINDSIKSSKAIKYYLNYYEEEDIYELPQINAFRRKGDKLAYQAPHFVIKKGLKDGIPCATFLDYNCAFRDGVYGFYSEKSDSKLLKIITAYLNSEIINYYLFQSISSYGIERDQIMKNEYLDVPFAPFTEKQKGEILDAMNELIKQKKKRDFSLVNFKKEIDSIFSKSFNISRTEKYLIEDGIKYNIDLFHKGMNSVALKNVTVSESRNYAKTLCDLINDYLGAATIKLSATVYDIANSGPLNLVVFKFAKTTNISEGNRSDVSDLLKTLDTLTITKESQSIYLKKQVKYYNDDTVYIIKPNQKRFWTRSLALSDSKDLISEIIKMK